MKNRITLITAISLCILSVNVWAESPYKEGWTWPLLAKYKMKCLEGFSTANYFYLYAENKDLEGKISYQSSELEDTYKKSLPKAYDFCSCVWDSAAKDYTVDELNNLGEPLSTWKMIMHKYDKYSDNGSCAIDPTVNKARVYPWELPKS